MSGGSEGKVWAPVKDELMLFYWVLLWFCFHQCRNRFIVEQSNSPVAPPHHQICCTLSGSEFMYATLHCVNMISFSFSSDNKTSDGVQQWDIIKNALPAICDSKVWNKCVFFFFFKLKKWNAAHHRCEDHIDLGSLLHIANLLTTADVRQTATSEIRTSTFLIYSNNREVCLWKQQWWREGVKRWHFVVCEISDNKAFLQLLVLSPLSITLIGTKNS